MAKHITLIVTGSVAAVKTFQLAEQLQNAGYEIDFVVTKAVWEHKFFESPKYKPSAAQLDYLKQHAIDEHDDEKIRAAVSRSDKILVCPASADFISQIVNENSKLGTLLRHTDTPLFIAPAMNVMMWQHPAVTQNVENLKHATFLGPISGPMACGDMGYGRLADINDIVNGLEQNSQHLFEKARITHSVLPQATNNKIKNILLMVHHNENNQATAYAQSLVDSGFHVQCVLSPQARDAAGALQVITGKPPVCEHYQNDPQGMEHIRLPEQNDAVVIAPTSEPYLAEMARGAAGSLCGCTYLATKKPVIIIAEHSPHIPTLKTHGATILANAQQLRTYLKDKTMAQDLAGKKILVFAGHPRERVDTFRFYFNDTIAPGHAAAEAKQLHARGAEVTVIAPAAEKLKLAGIKVIDTSNDGKKIESARHMLAAGEQMAPLEKFDTVLQLAGISSIACEKPATSKIQKTGPDKAQLFDVVGNVDVKTKLQAIFPNVPVAGYDQYQQWFGDASVRPSSKSHVTPEVLKTPAQNVLSHKAGKLSGKRVVVTTARTEEILTSTGDKITNFFSGRQGQAIARACADLGAEVTLISGPTQLPDIDHPNVKTTHVVSARQMHEAAMKRLEQPADVFIGAAAVADFGVEHPENTKLKEGELKTLALQENPSIVGDAAKLSAKRPRIVISFAAQSPETIVEYAQKKFHKLGVDLTVANPIGDSTVASRDPSKNHVMFIDESGIRQLPEMSKEDVGVKIADEVANLLLKAKPIPPSDLSNPASGTAAGFGGR